MNANSFITTDELVFVINHSKEIDRGDEMGPYAIKKGKYIYIYPDWRDARDDDHKGRWFMMIPVDITNLAELTDREAWDPEVVPPESFWPLMELVSKYVHTPLIFRGTVLSNDDKEEMRHRLMGYLKDDGFSEDYRNGRIDATHSIMHQFGMEEDYKQAKESYEAKKLKAVNE